MYVSISIIIGPPITTDPPTFTEHADVTCTDSYGKTTRTGVERACKRDQSCPAFEDFGDRGRRCKGEVKFGDGSDDEITGMKGLKAEEGRKVFIKGRCKEGIIFNCYSLDMFS